MARAPAPVKDAEYLYRALAGAIQTRRRLGRGIDSGAQTRAPQLPLTEGDTGLVFDLGYRPYRMSRGRIAWLHPIRTAVSGREARKLTP